LPPQLASGKLGKPSLWDLRGQVANGVGITIEELLEEYYRTIKGNKHLPFEENSKWIWKKLLDPKQFPPASVRLMDELSQSTSNKSIEDRHQQSAQWREQKQVLCVFVCLFACLCDCIVWLCVCVCVLCVLYCTVCVFMCACVCVCVCVCGCSCWCWCWSWCVCLCGWVGGCADAHTRPGPRSHPRPCVSFHVYCTVLYSTYTVLYCIVLNVLHCTVHVHASVRGCRPYNGMCGACVLAGAHFRRVAEIEEYCEHL
jgi:hypothetical protein